MRRVPQSRKYKHFTPFGNVSTGVGAGDERPYDVCFISIQADGRPSGRRQVGGLDIKSRIQFLAMLPDHEIEIRVRYYETDAQGFVHHANYFQYFELARVEQLLALGHDYAQLEREGIILVVSKIACKYHRPCRFGDTLRLQIRTVRARAARIDHEYRLLRGNELLAEAESTLACIDREGRVQRLPEYLLEPVEVK
jgi:acyl-CoA thioester hydrolase